MFISGTRTGSAKGAVAVVYTTTASPFIGGYRFDGLDTTQPWKVKYSDVTGDNVPEGVSSVLNYGNDIAVAPSNSRVLFGAQNSTKLHIYNFNWISGFGSLSKVDPSSSVPEEFTNITGVCFSQDESHVAISALASPSSNDSYMSVYNWDEGLAGLEYRISTFRDVTSVTSWALDSELVNESGSDEQFVLTSTVPPSGTSRQVILGYGTVAPSVVYYRELPFNSSTQYYGDVLYPPSQSPVSLYESQFPDNRYVVTVMDNGVMYFVEVSGGYFLSYVPNSSSPQFSPTADGTVSGYTAKYAMFDPHGRLIIAQTDSPYLSIWSVDPSNGSFAKIDDYPSWAGGEINTLAYDKDQDILFVSSQSSPYITAFRMSNTGFDFKYPDPASVPSASVVRMSLAYDERWKSYNA